MRKPLTRRKPTTRQLVETLTRKVDSIMTAVEDLTTAVTALEGAETAAAAEFTVLAEEIAGLKAGNISEAEVESLATKAQAVATALTGATPSGQE